MLIRDGYRQAISTHGDPVEETLSLRISGSSLNALASNMQTLDGFLTKPYELQEYQMYQSLWLRSQLGTESNTRQTCVFEAKRAPTVEVSGNSAKANVLREYVMGLKREGWWESTVSDNFSSASISALGGVMPYSGLGGDRPARVAMGRISGSSNSLNEFWLGVNSTRLDTSPSSFNPVWNLRLGFYTGDDTTTGTACADSSAQDGYKAVVTFSTTASMVPRVYITCQDVTNEQAGRFQVLLRAKVTSTRIARVRMGYGSLYQANLYFFNTLYPVQISSTSWKLYPLGQADIPVNPTAAQIGTGLRTAGIKLEAESVSGSGNLDLDCLILIPSLAGVLHVKGNNPVATGWWYELYHLPNGELRGKVTDNALLGVTIEELHPYQEKWGLYPGDGAIVCAAQYNDVSTKGNTFDLTLNAYERWITLRGNG